jgi:hypothetical protein
MDPVSLLPWLLWLLVVTPVVVHLHELAHAVAALRLTRDSVVVQGCVRPAGAIGLGRLHIAVGLPALSGVCFHADAPQRHGNAIIAAAGPLVSLMTGAIAGWAWFEGGAGTAVAAFALMSLVTGVLNLLPVELGPAGQGLHAPGESDGRVILRSLGLVAAGRRDRTRPVIRAPFVLALGAVAILTVLVAPLMLVPLAVLFGHAWLVARRDQRTAPAEGPPPTPPRWDSSRSVAPPSGR